MGNLTQRRKDAEERKGEAGEPALAKNLLSPATSALPFDAENGAWPTEGGYIRLRLRGEGVTCPLR